MNEKVFRKKSIEQVNSPEDLNSYLRVTNPPIWFAFIALFVLVAGAMIWMFKVPVATVEYGIICSDGNKAICYIQAEQAARLTSDSYVYMNEKEYTITDIAENWVYAQFVFNKYEMASAGYKEDTKLIGLTLEGKIEAGVYPCEVIIESVVPVESLFNISSNS